MLEHWDTSVKILRYLEESWIIFFHILISAIVLRQWKVYLELLQFRCPNRIVFLKMGCKRYGSNHYAKLIRVQNTNVFCHFVWFIYLWVENETLWKDTYIFERITFTRQIFRKSWKKMVCCQSFYKIYSEMAQRLRFPDQLVFRPRAKLEHMGPHSSVTHKLLWQSSALSSSYPKPFQLCKSNRKPANTNQSCVL